MAMTTVDQILTDIVRREGGLVDHPADPGGITNHGISLCYAKGIGLDLDGDGDTDADDIRRVTPAEAVERFREDFYLSPRIHTLPAALQPVLVDWAVNSGSAPPILALQRALNQVVATAADLFPGLEAITEDGRIGPRTRARAQAVLDQVPAAVIVNEICDARVRFYRALAGARPSQRVFLRGWLARANAFREVVR